MKWFLLEFVNSTGYASSHYDLITSWSWINFNWKKFDKTTCDWKLKKEENFWQIEMQSREKDFLLNENEELQLTTRKRKIQSKSRIWIKQVSFLSKLLRRRKSKAKEATIRDTLWKQGTLHWRRRQLERQFRKSSERWKLITMISESTTTSQTQFYELRYQIALCIECERIFHWLFWHNKEKKATKT